MSVAAASLLLTAFEETVKYDNDGDGLFALNCSLDSRRAESKKRRIDSDSRWKRRELGTRKFRFEIKSEEN